MTDTSQNGQTLAPRPVLPVRVGLSDGAVTPAALQDWSVLFRRRIVFAALNLVSMAFLTWGVVNVFAAGGWSATDWIIVACFFFGAPWTVMGLWNAVIGLWLLHGVGDGLARAAPHLDEADSLRPLTGRTALAMTVRNEAPARSFERLVRMRSSLERTGYGHLFDVHILSDTSDPAIAAEEERLFAELRGALGPGARYRRRVRNTGFKAGNVRDFLLGAGRDYEFYLPLDSDSLMSGDAIVAMQRIMEAHPRIGILQSLVTGLPSASAFARIFQFGMRHGMRSFTMGAAWWQGDCGPYWGHNALIRAAAFRRHCRLPVLPGRPPLGGHIMSHDQVEAVLMRRAGYEVRVMPVESDSWEENPPSLPDFIRRDLRWCQGNMQYWPLLGLRGLEPASRFQLFAAIMMYFGAPAWMLMTAAAGVKMVEGDASDVNLALGLSMFFIMFAVSLAPKVLGMIDILLTRGGTARYGGTLRFLLSGLTETVFSILMAPVVAFRVTLFLIGLMLGRAVHWGGQQRDACRLSWAEAVRAFWPQTVFGAGLAGAILVVAGPGTAVWALPVLAGLVLSVPFAVVTASPFIGRWAGRRGLCAIPDEVEPSAASRPLHGSVLPDAA